MQIVLVSYLFYPEPLVVSNMVKDMAIRLSDLGHEVVVLSPYPSRPYGYEFNNPADNPDWSFKRVLIDSYICPESNFIGRFIENISFSIKVSQYLNKNKNKIGCAYFCTFPVFSEFILTCITKKFKIPSVLHIEDPFPEPFFYNTRYIGKLLYHILFPLSKYALANATRVVTLAPQIGKHLEFTRKVKDIKIVYNWQNNVTFSQSRKLKSNQDFTFCYLGSLSPATNLVYVIDAFIKANNSKARLMIAGTGVLKEIIKNKIEGHDNIILSDAPANRVAEIQGQADVMLLPLRKYTALRAFPSKFPAYLFSRKPVLASLERNSDVGQIIKQYKCGWCVEPDDEDSLVTLFKIIPDVPLDELDQMGNAGYEYGQKFLTKEKNLKLITDIIIDSTKK